MAEISDLDRQIEQLRRCELIKESEVKALCAKAREEQNRATSLEEQPARWEKTDLEKDT